MASPFSGTPLRDLGPHASTSAAWSPGLETPDTSHVAVPFLQRDVKIDDADPSPSKLDFDGSFSETEVTEANESGAPWQKIGLKVLVSVVLFVILSILVEHFANDSVTRASKAFIEKIGLPGLFLGVFLFDGFPQPFTYVPLIFMAVKGGVAKSAVFLTCMSASYCAALSGYVAGSVLRGPSWGRDLFATLTEKYPYVPDLMERRGAVGVLLAAMLPVPLAVATWTAGFFSVNIPSFLVAALGRCPKIAVFVALSAGPAANQTAG